MDGRNFTGDGKTRLDVLIASQSEWTRSHVRKLIDDGCVSVDGEAIVKSGTVVPSGKEIEVLTEEPVLVSAEPENLPLDIVYEDSDLVVVNKRAGMVTHPCQGTPKGTLVNALCYHVKDLSGINGVFRPGIVHRLDKDTSGLLVVAKNDLSHVSLASQIEKKEAGRYYLALLEGNIKEDNGQIDQPIARSKTDRKKMAVCADGRRALSYYTVLERFGKYTLCEFKLATGRTHQIRVHAKFMGHPVVGDPVYNGKKEFDLNGQLLHAYKLELTHPSTGERMTFSCPLPERFENILEKLRKNL